MGKSKKKFIDKKNSSTFHVLHRSQRDVGGDGTSETILWPSPHNNQNTNDAVFSKQEGGDPTLNKWKEQAAELGVLEDDGYDYEQHMKPITGTGDFFDATGHRSDALRDARAIDLKDNDELPPPPQVSSSNVNDDVQEVSRQLESIALTPDCMDDDVAQALFGDFDETEFEEILDDFCVTAAQEPEQDDNEEEEFDFEAHVAALMERARKQDAQEAIGGVDIREHEVGKDDADFFAKAKSLRQVEEEDDDDDEDGHYYDEFDQDDVFGETTTPVGVVAKLGADEEKALCDKFEQTLLEYDSDEVGDLDEECEEICGDRPLEGDTQLEAALDEFLVEKEDEVFMEGTAHLPERRRKGGSGYAALMGTNMVPASQLYDHMGNIPEGETLEETLETADEILANPEMEPPAEEVLIDGKSYYTERTRNPWDCESILSTYSNLDNNPTTIGRRRKGKKKKNKKVSPEEDEEEEPVAQIQLSNKTGLPLGVLPSKNAAANNEHDFDDTFVSVNKGAARKKNETAEEKKARKLAVKEEREIARMQKKMMKEAFKDEFIKRSGDVVANDVAGKSVFRYA